MLKKIFRLVKKIFVPATDTEKLLSNLTAMNLGAQYAKDHPSKVKKCIGYCDLILKSKSQMAMLLNTAKKELSKDMSSDPLMQANIEMIFSSLKVNDDIDIRISKMIVQAFRNGLIFGVKNG